MYGSLWSLLNASPAASSVLAFVTTLHCAVTLLLRHRSQVLRSGSLVILAPSLSFVASPWVVSAPAWLVLAFACHISWFVACDALILRGASSAAATPLTARVTHASARTMPAIAPARQGGFQEQAVLAVIPETPDIRTFRFARPAGFSFTAGQFVMVAVELEGRKLVRCYSISSSPSAKGYLEISVRNQGQVSSFLHQTVRPGTTLSVRGPGGTFVYPAGSRPIVLLAAGIGITPLLSMLRHALETEPTRPVTLVFGARTEKQLPFLVELRQLEHRHPLFRLAIAISSGSENPEYFSGRVDRTLLEAVIPNVRESVYLICGPLPMIEEMSRTLSSLGVPAAQVQYEKFEAAVAAAESTRARVACARRLNVTLRQRGRVVEAGNGQTILEAAEAAGEEIPSMCRAGVCGTCRTRLLSGEVDGEFESIDERERAAGFVLACVARPVTDCEVDA